MRLLPVLVLAALPIGFALTSAAPAATSDEALHDSMVVLQKGQRAIKKMLADPEANQRELLGKLGEMEAAVVVALGEPAWPAPEGLEGVDAGLFEVGYKRTLVELLDSTLALQEATLKGDAEAAKAAYEQMSSLKKSGHTEYRDADAEER